MWSVLQAAGSPRRTLCGAARRSNWASEAGRGSGVARRRGARRRRRRRRSPARHGGGRAGRRSTWRRSCCARKKLYSTEATRGRGGKIQRNLFRAQPLLRRLGAERHAASESTMASRTFASAAAAAARASGPGCATPRPRSALPRHRPPPLCASQPRRSASPGPAVSAPCSFQVIMMHSLLFFMSANGFLLSETLQSPVHRQSLDK